MNAVKMGLTIEEAADAVKMGLTIEEAAECTGIGRNTMRKLVEWGKLPVLKVGRKAGMEQDSGYGVIIGYRRSKDFRSQADRDTRKSKPIYQKQRLAA